MTEPISIVVMYLVLAGLVALLARSQGRSPVAWFGIALLLTPLLAFLGVVLSSSPRDRR